MQVTRVQGTEQVGATNSALRQWLRGEWLGMSDNARLRTLALTKVTPVSQRGPRENMIPNAHVELGNWARLQACQGRTLP